MSYLTINESFKTAIQQIKDFSFNHEKKHMNKHIYFDKIFDREKVKSVCEKYALQYANKTKTGMGGPSYSTKEILNKKFDTLKSHINNKNVDDERKDARSAKDYFGKMTIAFPIYHSYTKGSNDKNDTHQSSTVHITFDSDGCHSAKANYWDPKTMKPTMTEIPGLKEAINKCKKS